MNTNLPSSEISNISIEEPQKIKRLYPSKKHEYRYPDRYNNAVFEKFNEMNTDTELQNDYKKWKAGKNYKTNRKITIGGKIHREIGKKFYIAWQTSWCTICVEFYELTNINATLYLQETEKIYNAIDIKNAAIKDYNKRIDEIVEKIKNLESWDDFVAFEGIKYGLVDKIKNNIHMENNCYGEMVFVKSDTRIYYHDRPYDLRDDTIETYSIYKCSKCNYEREVETSRTGGEYYSLSKVARWQ